MDQQSLLLKIDELMDLPAGTLQGAEPLSGLENWDSLALMNFIALVSEQFGRTLSPRQIASCETVSDLVKLAQPAAS